MSVWYVQCLLGRSGVHVRQIQGLHGRYIGICTAATTSVRQIRQRPHTVFCGADTASMYSRYKVYAVDTEVPVWQI